MEETLTVGPAHRSVAAGIPAVAHAMELAFKERALLPLLKINQTDGFDCPGCAWPDPDHRHLAEFCENGVKAVAGRQGRLTTPMHLRQESGTCEPVTTTEAEVIPQQVDDIDRERPGTVRVDQRLER